MGGGLRTTDYRLRTTGMRLEISGVDCLLLFSLRLGLGLVWGGKGAIVFWDVWCLGFKGKIEPFVMGLLGLLGGRLHDFCAP